MIPAFTPDTIPLDRLVEYLSQVAKVIGEPKDVHLNRIEASSTKPVLRVNAAVAPLARQQINAVRNGGGSSIQRAAYTRIRQMVRFDGDMPASLRDATGVLLHFPPSDEAAVAKITIT